MVVRVVSDTDSKGNFLSILIKGHANFGNFGNDIVCSGISAVVNGAVNFLYNNFRDHCKISFSDSEVNILVFKENNICQICIKMMIFQLKNIATRYPKYLIFCHNLSKNTPSV